MRRERIHFFDHIAPGAAVAVEVLVVDDDRLAAESFARLIEAETMLPTVFTDDPDEAVRIVQRHQIKVAVLDQKMPKQSGTALFKRLRENNPSLRAILSSGQADTQDLRDAIRERFMEMLDKNELRRLPSVVRKYYALHLSELVRRKYENISPLGVYRTGFSFREQR